MKRYNIRVNGAVYAVEVEEADAQAFPAPAYAPAPPAASAPLAQPAAPAAPAAPAPPAAPAAKESAPAANATLIECPMPGTILDVLVASGQSVKSGETLLVLEAMKMENEIVAPQDGVVDALRVSKGQSVNAGDVLVTLL